MKHGEHKPAPATQPRSEPKPAPQGGRSQATDMAGHRYGTGAALQSPRMPKANSDPAPAVQSQLEKACADLRERFGAQLQAGSAATGVPEAAAAAMILAEQQLARAAGTEVPLRFEPYVFFQETGRWLVATHKDQAAEQRAFSEAQAIDPQAAFESVRMGIAQLSGREATAAGHESPEAMLGAMRQAPEAQVSSLFSVIAADADLRGALAAEDWRAVAQLRAGPGYGALGYDDALAAGAELYRRAEKAAGGGDDDDSPKKPRKKRG